MSRACPCERRAPTMVRPVPDVAPNASSRRRGHTDAPWRAVIGIPPLVVRGYERVDRQSAAFARWVDPNAQGRERRRKRSLDVRLRDARGQLDAAAVALAQARLGELYAAIVRQEDRVTTGTADIPLTLADGFEAALATDGTGLYIGDTPHVRTMRVAADRVTKILGRATPWAEVLPQHLAAVWRRLAHASQHGEGARTAEATVAFVYRVAGWLRENMRIPPSACLPGREWRARLRAEWEQITETPVEPKRPRHTPEELYAIFEALPSASPRLALALELGAELRVGQVIRMTRMRIQIGIPHEVGPVPEGMPHGYVSTPGSGKKSGVPMALTPDQRCALERAWAGYLRDYERAFRAGTIRDYSIFPGGCFVEGVARVKKSPPRWNRRTALDHFHALERAAGITPVRGRGFYGIRRVAADLAPEFSQDDRVLDRIGGHGREAREGTYQDRENLQFVRDAARVRAALRTGGRRPSRADDASGEHSSASLGEEPSAG